MNRCKGLILSYYLLAAVAAAKTCKRSWVRAIQTDLEFLQSRVVEFSDFKDYTWTMWIDYATHNRKKL